MNKKERKRLRALGGSPVARVQQSTAELNEWREKRDAWEARVDELRAELAKAEKNVRMCHLVVGRWEINLEESVTSIPVFALKGS